MTIAEVHGLGRYLDPILGIQEDTVGIQHWRDDLPRWGVEAGVGSFYGEQRVYAGIGLLHQTDNDIVRVTTFDGLTHELWPGQSVIVRGHAPDTCTDAENAFRQDQYFLIIHWQFRLSER